MVRSRAQQEQAPLISNSHKLLILDHNFDLEAGDSRLVQATPVEKTHAYLSDCKAEG